mmetsp:Transcript_49137/g.106865  ORF Transcript_49137/g.106865 Transcript_49137/m.106865 type:complete len:266 (+) Transcript_49137:943-1740(+)
MKRLLSELPLVPCNGHLAWLQTAGEHEHLVAGHLRQLCLLRRSEGDEGPLPPGLRVGLQVNVDDLPELGELLSQLILGDVVRQGTHEDFPRHRHRGGISNATCGGNKRLLAEHALISRQCHLAGSKCSRKLKGAVRHLHCKNRLFCSGEGQERPLAARIAVLLQKQILYHAILGELIPQIILRDPVRQRAHKNLLDHWCNDLPKAAQSSPWQSCIEGASECTCWIVTLTEHALILGGHHVARAIMARDHELAVAGLLRMLCLLWR